MAKKPPVELGFFLDSIVHMEVDLDKIADDRAHYLMVLAGVIFSVSLTQIYGFMGITQVSFLILILVSLITIILCLLAIRPRMWRPGWHMPTNRMFFSSVCKNFTREQYKKQMLKLTSSREAIIEEYADEIYSHAIVLKNKFFYVRVASSLLLIGILVGAFMFILGLF